MLIFYYKKYKYKRLFQLKGLLSVVKFFVIVIILRLEHNIFDGDMTVMHVLTTRDMQLLYIVYYATSS